MAAEWGKSCEGPEVKFTGRERNRWFYVSGNVISAGFRIQVIALNHHSRQQGNGVFVRDGIRGIQVEGVPGSAFCNFRNSDFRTAFAGKKQAYSISVWLFIPQEMQKSGLVKLPLGQQEPRILLLMQPFRYSWRG